MTLIADYTITETLQEDDGAALYRATSNRDRHPVLLRTVPRGDQLQTRELASFRHECSLVGALDLPTVLKVEACDAFSDRPVLVLEDFGGITLESFLHGPCSVADFLPTAIRMAGALADLHSRGIIHGDLTPRSFIVKPGTDEVKLTGVGLASQLSREQPSVNAPHLIEGTLPYMSPEQTGRMNRVIDSRSDLYSLGVIFYQMLTGTLPFHGSDPLEWVHCHVARVPPVPRERVADLPGPLSDIVTKLLAKMADDRYQSAAGLKADLETCLSQWRAGARVEPFALGARDISDQFVVPHRLYGREREVGALVRAFERVSATGTPQTVLISGYSGIGKTTLVQELYRPIVRARGYFIAGKFDQYKRGIPYAIISQAFGGLVRQLLGESDERIAVWRSRLQEALGINAQLMVDVVPELALIIGNQPPVPPIGLSEAESRFHLVFRHFLGAIARPEHPLALFIDDLQWVDSASMKLIEHAITHADTRHLLLIGAYRSNQIGPSHPLKHMLDEMIRCGATVETLELGPLSAADQRQLIADCTHAAPTEVDRLSQLVYDKTGGNPFFTIRFLTALCQDGLIVFNRRALAWQWQFSAIKARGFTDNVVDLMVSRLERLPASTQDVLRLAAAIGDRIDVGTLSVVSRGSEDDTHDSLEPAVREGLLLREEDSYAFLHDRIQQAAYTLLREDERAAVQLQIGRLLLSNTPAGSVAERVFDIVDQLNRGASLVISQDEKRELAELNLLAAQRARTSAAYPSAVTYASAGLAVLSEDSWRTQYELTFTLSLERASCDYLSGHFEEAESRLADLMTRAATRIDRAAVAVIKMNLHTNQVRSDLAVETAIDCLRDFGMVLVPHPTRAQIEQAYDETRHNLGGRQIADLVDLPRMTDPDVRAAMDVLTVLAAPALQTDSNLLCLTACHAVNLSVRHGNSEASSIAYVYFGMISGALFDRHDEAHQFGRLGYDLVQARVGAPHRALVFVCFAGNIQPWTTRIRDTIPGNERAFATAMEAGDVTFACYAQHHHVAAKLIAGDALDDVYRASETARAFVRQAQFGLVDAIILSQQRFIKTMQGLTESLSSFDDAGFRQDTFEQTLELSPVTMSLPACLYFIWKAQARYLAGEYEEAVRAAAKARPLLWSAPSFQEIPDYYYFTALALAARYPVADADQWNADLPTMRAHEAKFRKWAESCPENFASKHALICAELARVSGQTDEAMQLYEEAIRTAREGGVVQNEAIANEVASRFFRQRGLESIADAYLREARSCYARWGAEGKVRQIDRHYPHLRARREPSGVTTSPEQLDAISVAKASQAISREVVLPDLLKTMLRLIVEQAGADRGWLLLVRADQLSLVAAAEEGTNEIKLAPTGPVTDESTLPWSVINYVKRTAETVALDDAARRGRYIDDPYVIKHRPKSVLCLPITRHAKPVGIVYLENNLTTHAFAADRLLILHLLAAQAAISLENAQLYDDLQRQQAATRASQAQLQAIVDSSAAVIFLKDTQGRFLLVNRRFEDIVHLPRGAVVGKTDYDLLPRAVADTVRANDEKVLQAGHTMEWEETIPHDDGLHTYLSLKFPLRDAAGVAYGVCAISTEITARKHGEDALKQAIRTRDEFLSVASHELRTPLTSLTLSLESIRRSGGSGPRFERALGIASQGSERLQRLIEELLDISRFDSGQIALERSEVELEGLARNVVARFEPDIVRAGSPVVIQGGPLVGRWDRSRIDQVVANILGNALKFGPGMPVEITIAREDDRALLSVQDHGIGIDPANQQRIFERFQRAVSERHYGGLGLGLYICHRIVTAHGGSIRVESSPGAGARFTIELPLATRAE